MSMGRVHISLLFFSFILSVCAETPVTVPVPPLQWIRLNSNGTTFPPALAYAAAGFDTTNNQLVVFGGETSGGSLNSNTYLFDMATMGWTTPNPATNTNTKPPARSRALYGQDMIASYRNGLVVYGGMGQQEALSDVWEYAFNGQFWYNIPVTGDTPSARFSAVGGGDPPSIANADTNLLTTFWLTGGLTGSTNSSSSASYDDIYRLQLKGTVAPNIQDATGTWSKIASTSSGDNIGARIGQAALSMRTNEGQAKLGFFGGCASTDANVTCAQQDAHVIVTSDGSSMSWNEISKCPSARLGAVLTPNYNGLFSDMAFLLLGISPNDNTTDTNGLDHRGEIDVLSISQGVWTRVLPSCDPSSNPPCPVPREGAAVVSSANTMAGTTSASSSDIIIFGGKDKDGNVLSDAWILRATTAQVTFSNQTTWGSEYGNGVLGSGVNNHGQGVTVEFLAECAQPPPTGTSSSSPSHSSGSGSDSGSGSNNSDRVSPPPYTAGTTHKALAAVSVLVILASVLLARLTTRPNINVSTQRTVMVVACVAWALGAAGFATSFTSTKRTNSSNTSLARRESAAAAVGFASTGHAIVGCILFVLAYIVAPIVILIRSKYRPRHRYENHHLDEASEMHSIDPARHSGDGHTPGEKSYLSHRNNISTSGSIVPQTPEGHAHDDEHEEEDDDGEPIGAGKKIRLRDSAFAPSAFIKDLLWSDGWKRSQRQRVPSQPSLPSNTTASEFIPDPSPPTETGFVVLNRGKNALDRRTPAPGERVGPLGLPVNLSDVSWLERRRNLGVVADLDYAMSQLRPNPPDQRPSSYFNPANSPPQNSVTPPPVHAARHSPAKFPDWKTILLRSAFQALLFALSIFTVIALFTKSGSGMGTPLGAVFVVLMVVFYATVVVLALRGKPRGSILVVIFSRLQGTDSTSTTQRAAPASVVTGEGSESRPLAERSMAESATLMSSIRASRGYAQPSHHSVDESARDDDDEVEGIEREMGRRDVSIVTVPKRRLFIANSDTP